MKNAKYIVLFLTLVILLASGCSQKVSESTQDNSDILPPPLPDTTSSEKQGDDKGVSVGTDTPLVKIKDFKFVPKEIKVKAGTTVTWKNEDSVGHTVESNDGSITSDNLELNDEFQFTFDKPGKIDYICGPHPFMKGSVIVE